jgi:hypothetical protein
MALVLMATTAQATVTPAFTAIAKKDYFDTLVTHTLKIALYTQSAATLSSASTIYVTTGEVTGAGYTAGGNTLTGCTSTLNGSTAQITCTGGNTWAASTITSDAAMVYDTTNGNRALGIFTFTSASSSNGLFTVTLPANLLYLQ